MWNTVEGNLSEIEEILWKRSLIGDRNFNAGYLYSFKEPYCSCKEEPDGYVLYPDCPLYEGTAPFELHSLDQQIILERNIA